MDFSSFGLPSGGKGFDDLDMDEDEGAGLGKRLWNIIFFPMTNSQECDVKINIVLGFELVTNKYVIKRAVAVIILCSRWHGRAWGHRRRRG